MKLVELIDDPSLFKKKVASALFEKSLKKIEDQKKIIGKTIIHNKKSPNKEIPL